ncbi:MAG: RodZ domain-containing protein [Prochlorococcaceae cyanobacterium]
MSESIPETPSHSGHPLLRLGTALREAREAQGLSLETLANQLCMGSDQLRALEEGAADRLPEKVFVVAQARRVASVLGLEADPLIEELRRTDLGSPSGNGASTNRRISASSLPSPPLSPQAPSPLPSSTSNNRSPGTLPRWALGALGGLVLVTSLGTLAWRQWQAVRARSEPPEAPLAADRSPALAQSNPESSKPGVMPPGTKAVVVLSSPEGSWIAVRSGSGQSLYEGLLKGERQFPADPGLRVLAGRPDLVTVRIGGSIARRLGPINEVIWRPLR